MKNFKYLLIMLVSLTVSVSCNNDDDDSDVDPLVGTWDKTKEYYHVDFIVFKENFTGIMQTGLGEEYEEIVYNFTWSTDGNLLTFTPPIFNRNGEKVPYSISGNTITFFVNDNKDKIIGIFKRR